MAAAAPDDRYSSDEEAPDLLRCTLCTNLLEDQLMLPCQHTYCKTCLPSIVNNNVIVCPDCEEKVELEENGLEGLLVNRTVQKILELVCKSCKERMRKARCVHCERRLCRTCYREHKARAEERIGRETENVDYHTQAINVQINSQMLQLRKEILKMQIEEMSGPLTPEKIDENFNEVVGVILERKKRLQDQVARTTEDHIQKVEEYEKAVQDNMEKLEMFQKQADEIPDDAEVTQELRDIVKDWSKELKRASRLKESRPDRIRPAILNKNGYSCDEFGPESNGGSSEN